MTQRLLFMALATLTLAGLAQAGDKEDVAAVIDKYRVHEETGDMLAQGELMTRDRVMMYVGGRLTGDNRKVMQDQQTEMNAFQARFPGVKYQIEIRNMEIRIWQDAAMATLDWYPTRIVPPTLPPGTVRQLGPAKTPQIVALMLVKQAGAWKIAFTGFVPRQEPAG